MSLAPGTRVGPYEVLGPLGAGGMGEVFRAHDTRLAREVAVKVLPARLSKDKDALARFEREAKAVAALSHPNILSIFDFGRHDGTAYAVTELLEGETLRERLKAGALPARKAAELAIQIAHGLAAAHGKGIVHRDLKPENVFVSRDGRVKILDFGLARQLDAGAAGGDELPGHQHDERRCAEQLQPGERRLQHRERKHCHRDRECDTRRQLRAAHPVARPEDGAGRNPPDVLERLHGGLRAQRPQPACRTSQARRRKPSDAAFRSFGIQPSLPPAATLPR